MNVVFRADASIQIGIGHIMRCMTLAKQLQDEGATIIFICRQLEGHLETFLKSSGFEVEMMINHAKEKQLLDLEWQKEYWNRDVNETITLVKKRKIEIDLLVVDHYGIDYKWENEIRSIAPKIMVIDDIAGRLHECDVLLDQNLYDQPQSRYNNLVPASCKLLLGPNYALLREEFLQLMETDRKAITKVESVLVFFGGADATGETLKTLKAIQLGDFSEIHFDLIIGISNPFKNEIMERAAHVPNVSTHVQVNNMAAFMLKSDIMIGAGGATTWERCFMQLPSLTITVAANQVELTNQLSSLAVTDYLGCSSEVTVTDLKNAIQNACSNLALLNKMSRNSSHIMNLNMIRKKTVSQVIKELI